MRRIDLMDRLPLRGVEQRDRQGLSRKVGDALAFAHLDRARQVTLVRCARDDGSAGFPPKIERIIGEVRATHEGRAAHRYDSALHPAA